VLGEKPSSGGGDQPPSLLFLALSQPRFNVHLRTVSGSGAALNLM
jgi:hypothetical protein